MAVLTAAALAIAPGASAGDRPKVTRVRASISYATSGGNYEHIRLTIRRGNAEWRSGDIGTAYLRRPVLRVLDFDADGEPEVQLDTYSGGAHCCFVSRFFRYDPSVAAYGQVRHRWGNVNHRASNLDRGRPLELVTRDDRFAYAFTSFVRSYFPLRIWRFDAGRLVDVTRRFPRHVEADARRLATAYHGLRAEGEDVRGVLAAWLADQILLGREDAGWAAIESALRSGELGPDPALAGWPQGRSYVATLRSFLHRLGYSAR